PDSSGRFYYSGRYPNIIMLRLIREPLIESYTVAPGLCAWLARKEERSLLIANERRVTQTRRAQRSGPEGAWAKRPGWGVARLGRSPCYGAAPGALHPNLLGANAIRV